MKNLNEASLGSEQKKLIASKLKPVLAKYGVKGTLSVRNGSTISLSIVEGTIDFIGNAANVMATQVIDKPHYYSVVKNLLKYNEVQVNDRQITSQFSGNAKTALLAILKVLNINNYSKSDWTNDWVQVGHYININIGKIDKPYKCTGTPEKPNDALKTILGDQTVKESKLTEDAKQLIQNPILKVFDQFGKQYLAQVLDASLNKMIQAAARRGVKVTVSQLIAEIKDKPNGTTSQALFKAMATVIKQVSAQIPTIVTTNVSSISESHVFENTIDKKTFQAKLESIITPIFEKYGFRKSHGDGWIKEIGKNKTTGRVFLKSYKGTKRRYSVYPDQIETEQFYLEGQHFPTKDVVCMFDLKDTTSSYIQSACKEVSTLMDRYYGVK